MTDDEASAIRYKIDVEGFDYCFRYYSHFEEIEDPEFHRLRKAYAEAAEALDGYIPDPELDDEEDEDEGTGEEDEGSEEVEF